LEKLESVDNDNSIVLKLTPIRKLFYNEDQMYGGWGAVPSPECEEYVELNSYNNFTLRGNTSQLFMNAEYNATVLPKEDKKYGLYYEIMSIYQDLNNTEGQRAFLAAILTTPQVKHLYEAYPDQNIVELIKSDKIDVSKVKGIGKPTLDKIKDKLIENVEFQKAFVTLKKYGLTNNLITKLVKHYKSSDILLKVLNTDPYQITDVSGIGFLKADEIALALGAKEDSPQRLQNAIRYCILQASQNGHTYITIDHLLDEVYELIHISYEKISTQLSQTKGIIQKQDRISLQKFYNDEKYIAKQLLLLLKNNIKLNVNIERFINKKEKELNLHLTDQQQQIMRYVTESRVCVLSGAAGTGKSQTSRFIIDMLEELGLSYRLVSPTAKAAKVLKEYTGKETQTIHKAIGLGIGDYNQSSGFISDDVVLVDEASMVNVSLCARLIEACNNPHVRFIFVGDIFQLVSIGAGRLLQDLIDSEQIPYVQLDKVFRQAEGGALDKATKIRQGQTFLNHDFQGIKKYGKDLTIACIPSEKIPSGYKYYYQELLKQYEPEDITVVTPTNKSVIGTVAINNVIQSIVNPASDDKEEYKINITGTILRQDDICMNTRNTYDEFLDFDEPQIESPDGEAEDNTVPIINGDYGTVEHIDDDHEQIIMQLEDGQRIIVPFNKAKQFIHGYSLTTHRMQGSSNKAVIVIADKANIYMLSRNLLYTACTRQTEQLIILTQASTLNRSIKKKTDMLRHTWLKDMLIEFSKHVDELEDGK
jgi:RecD/TraA family predicted helicase